MIPKDIHDSIEKKFRNTVALNETVIKLLGFRAFEKIRSGEMTGPSAESDSK
jgi:hypothetical protein